MSWWDEPVVIIKLILSAVAEVYSLFHLSPSLSHTTHAEVAAASIFLEHYMRQYPDPPHLFRKVKTQLTEWQRNIISPPM